MWLFILFVLVLLFGFMAFTGAPYVPSKPSDIKKAFTDLYPLSTQDHLVDIGSGDGMVLRAASRAGARATGYEINPILALVAKLLSRGDKKVTIKNANFWNANFPQDTTVVYTFGDSRDIAKMAKKVEQQATKLQRELTFISYAFEISGYTKTKTVGTHHMYRIRPLLIGEA